MKDKKRFISLKFKMLVVTLAGVAIAAVIFGVLFVAGNFAVWKYYMDDRLVEQRSQDYINEFRKYVKENDLLTTDVDRIQSWISGGTLELIIYKDGQLIYSPDRFEDGDLNDDDMKESDSESDTVVESESESESESETELTTGSESAAESETESEAVVPEYRPGDGRNFLDYLNADDRLEYERLLADILDGNRELSPVVFKDGTLLVTVVDYSSRLMYSVAFLVSLGISLLVLVIILLISFSNLTGRITKLASRVKTVEGGQVDIPVYAKGDDEISDLASNINSMRHSIVSTMSKEREAWEANAGLITAMSHDIRTPLTVLMGYLDLMELQSEDEASREYLAACRENAVKLKKLSDDMFQYFLVFGRRELSLSFSTYSADEVIHHMLDEHVILLREKGYEVVLDQCTLGVDIVVDLLYLSRVVDNVFSNINKYASVDVPVRLAVSLCDDKIIIELTNGIRRETEVESNEIGLQTCKKIMQQMEGSFEAVKSENEFISRIILPKSK